MICEAALPNIPLALMTSVIPKLPQTHYEKTKESQVSLHPSSQNIASWKGPTRFTHQQFIFMGPELKILGLKSQKLNPTGLIAILFHRTLPISMTFFSLNMPFINVR